MSESKHTNGGYGIPYDPEPALNKLSTSYDEAINELWENLYHQGDVGVASYASVPALVSAGALSLAAAIEVARNNKTNPDLPNNIKEEYEKALKEVLNSKPQNEEQLMGYYIIHASLNGQKRLAKALNLIDIEEVISEHG